MEFRCRFLEYSDSEDEAEMEIKQDLNTIKDKEKAENKTSNHEEQKPHTEKLEEKPTNPDEITF